MKNDSSTGPIFRRVEGVLIVGRQIEFPTFDTRSRRQGPAFGTQRMPNRERVAIIDSARWFVTTYVCPRR